jgi:hypothetical protein
MDHDHPQRERLLSALARMGVWSNADQYYALTLTASRANRPLWSAYSHFAGQSERFPGWERREASIVDAAKMTALWDDLGQSWLVVNDSVDLALWIRLGGNALVEMTLAQERLSRMVTPHEVAPDGPMGFLRAESLTRQQLKHKTSRAVRKRVFERDGHTCRRCGRTSEEVRLTRHHVLPNSVGGLTQENNLVSLCADCHDDCHAGDSWYPEPDLLFGVLLAEQMKRLNEDYDEAVRRHRRLVASMTA